MVTSLLRTTADVDKCWGAEMCLLESSQDYHKRMQNRYKLCGILQQEIEKVEGVGIYDGYKENIPTVVIENFARFLDQERTPNQEHLQLYIEALNQHRALTKQATEARIRIGFGNKKPEDDEIIAKAKNSKMPEIIPLKDANDPQLLTAEQQAFIEMLRENEDQASPADSASADNYSDTQQGSPSQTPTASPEPDADNLENAFGKLGECKIL